MKSIETYHVIASMLGSLTYEADNRKANFIPDERIEFYKIGDAVTKLEDAYKWENEEDAHEYLSKHIEQYDNYEVRKLIVTYEIE